MSITVSYLNVEGQPRTTQVVSPYSGGVKVGITTEAGAQAIGGVLAAELHARAKAKTSGPVGQLAHLARLTLTLGRLRFVAWAAELGARGKRGEFGKWPWQEDYGLWLWQRRQR